MEGRAGLLNLISDELDAAYEKHGRDQWGRHEFYAVLLEEIDEIWEVIKRDGPSSSLLREMAQAGAMLLRYAETGNRYGNDL